MSKETYLFVKKTWCKRCNTCVEFCPKGVFIIGEDGYPVPAHIEKCIQCRMCITMCPDFAIFADPEDVKKFEDR